MRSIYQAGVLALALAAAGTGLAVAADGGGSGASVVCDKGYVYSEQQKSCVRVNSGLLDDDELFEQGRALAKAGHYPEALAVLEAIEDQNDSMVLTMIGYSKRKSGSWNEGLTYYHKALAIDPDNVNAREYLGEAYVIIGRRDLAEIELATIAEIAGTGSEQYRDLAEAISTPIKTGQPEQQL
jgi:tetratricopeptide (TPR) repeat protein